MHRKSLQIENLENRNLLNADPAFLPGGGLTQQAIAEVSQQAMVLDSEYTLTDLKARRAANAVEQASFVGDVDGDGREDIVHYVDGEWTVSKTQTGGHRCQAPNVSADQVAELPRECVTTTIEPEIARPPIFVPAGGDLQAAIDQARPGDVIELEAGATYPGRFEFGPKDGDEWIHIRGSRHAELPGSGTRIDPEKHAQLMPKILASGAGANGTAFHFLPGAHHFRIEGIEITSDFQGTEGVANNLVVLQAFGVRDAADLPHHIIFDRTYVHGNPTGNVLNGMRLDGKHVAVVDSHISDFHAIGRESHAVYAADGAGPIKIVNNHLEAAGVVVIFGGDDPEVPGLINQDIEIRRNRITKREEWREGPAVHKYLLEFKNARRVLASENIIENAWADNRFSDGTGVLIQPVNQEGDCHWCVTEDITLSHNIVRNVSIGFKLAGQTLWKAERAERILIENNLLYDLDETSPGGGIGTPFRVLEDYDEVHIIHNTAFANGRSAISMGSSLWPDQFRGLSLVVRDNLISHNTYGVKGDGSDVGIGTVADWVEDYEFANNVFFGENINANKYPDNFVTDQIDFTNPAVGDFRLDSVSPFNNAATDGGDIGVDFSLLLNAWHSERGNRSSVNHLTQEHWGNWSTSVLWDDIFIADVNGDGKDDVVGRTGRDWWVGRSTGTSFVSEKWGRWSDTVVWDDVLVADANGDGKDDIVGRTDDDWWIAESQGDHFQNKLWTEWEIGDWKDVQSLDIDANGSDDIVGRLNGQWTLSRQIGPVVVTQPWAQWDDTVEWKDVTTADVNGDLLDDIVGRANGEWWVTLSQGNDWRTERWDVWSENVEWSHINLADMNGDGKDDLIGQAVSRWWVSLAKSGEFDSSNWGKFGHSLQLDDVQVADMDGDGKDDLVAFIGGAWFAAISGENALIY